MPRRWYWSDEYTRTRAARDSRERTRRVIAVVLGGLAGVLAGLSYFA
jgi:hypothetical protein